MNDVLHFTIRPCARKKIEHRAHQVVGGTLDQTPRSLRSQRSAQHRLSSGDIESTFDQCLFHTPWTCRTAAFIVIC